MRFKFLLGVDCFVVGKSFGIFCFSFVIILEGSYRYLWDKLKWNYLNWDIKYFVW